MEKELGSVGLQASPVSPSPSLADEPATPSDGNAETMAAWLDECARYFDKQPTNGSDGAHWSNVYNAQNARKIAAYVRGLVQ